MFNDGIEKFMICTILNSYLFLCWKCFFISILFFCRDREIWRPPYEKPRAYYEMTIELKYFEIKNCV